MITCWIFTYIWLHLCVRWKHMHSLVLLKSVTSLWFYWNRWLQWLTYAFEVNWLIPRTIAWNGFQLVSYETVFRYSRHSSILLTGIYKGCSKSHHITTDTNIVHLAGYLKHVIDDAMAYQVYIQSTAGGDDTVNNQYGRISPCGDCQGSGRHLHYLWNTNMAAWLHHGNDLPQELNCLTSLGRITSHIGNKTKLSSLSFDRQLKFKITAWPKLGNKAAENGNKSIKCAGSYFTGVKAFSAPGAAPIAVELTTTGTPPSTWQSPLRPHRPNVASRLINIQFHTTILRWGWGFQ